jgi:hypothetical protein
MPGFKFHACANVPVEWVSAFNEIAAVLPQGGGLPQRRVHRMAGPKKDRGNSYSRFSVQPRFFVPPIM